MSGKKVLTLSMAAVMAASMMSGAAFAGETEAAAGSDLAADISLWTYPVGSFGDETAVQALIDDFKAQYPNVNVTVQLLDYTNGDDQVNTAIEGGNAPDLIFEGPERLVANWGAKGVMADISDLWDDASKSEITANVEAACRNADGVYYEYPVCMTAHTMAVNRDLFEAADALQYLDEETHTWTTDNFLKAVQAVYDYRVSQGEDDPTVGAVYCNGQGGDQGTRALVNNLYSGKFTNAEHTEYAVDSEENKKALQAIVDSQGLKFDPSIVGGDEINLFVNQTLSMAFCWNVGAQTAHAGVDADFTILPMAFPSDDGIPELCGGIWGFGVFDNGDADRIAAAKAFIKFLDGSAEEYTKAVTTSTYFPVRDAVNGEDVSKMYDGNETMTTFSSFMQYFGDYYQVVPGWAEARTAWWNMLQQIDSGTDIGEALKTFNDTANAAAAAALS